MEELNPNKDSVKTKKRPDILTVLCILTFIGSGLGVISFLTIAISYGSLNTIIAKSDIDIPGMDILLSAGVDFYIVGSILYSISLFGAIKMWNLKKIGFHYYTIAQIILLMLPAIFRVTRISIGSSIFTGLFIILYGTNLKYMT